MRLSTLVLAFCLAACAGDAPGSAPRTLFGGNRPAVLQVPVTYDGSTALPLLVVLHGYTSTGVGQLAYFHLDSLANQAGAFILAPNGKFDGRRNRYWNGTDACCDLDTTGVDDVAYLKGLIADVRHDYRVDPKRIYLWGHSNGAFMAHRMACDDADEIAAIMALAGATWQDATRCAPTSTVSVLDVHGDADRTIVYTGGAIQDHAYPGEAITMDRWNQLDGCTGGPADDSAPLDLVEKLPGAETAVTRWTGCPAGLGVELWTIHGGGHVPRFEPGFATAAWAWMMAHPKS